MKQIVCEMCGNNDLIKQDGVYVCQYCGTKYTVEEARKMMVEGTVDVQGTVRVDVSDKVKNLYIMARRAKDDDNAELASKYYEMITFENPNDWESLFYFNYFKAKQTNLRDMENSVIRLSNSLDSVFDLITNSDKTDDEKWYDVKEIMVRINIFCESCIQWAKRHYEEFPHVAGTVADLKERAQAIGDLQKRMADLLEKYFPINSVQEITSYLKSYVENYLLLDTAKDYVKITLQYHSTKLINAEERIKKLDPNYIPLINNSDVPQNNPDTIQKKSLRDTYAKVGVTIGGIIGAIGGIVFYKYICSIDPPDVGAAISGFVSCTLLGRLIGGVIGGNIEKK